jgi:glycerol-3-phosphate dehydrogenase subunit B
MSPSEIRCDVMVIGAGMAGMAASLFAADKGLDTVQAGAASEIIYASGLMDLLAVHPVDQAAVWDNPWQALAALRHDAPQHPYAKLSDTFIQKAIDRVTGALGDAGLPYVGSMDKNTEVLTALGTVKPTFRVPQTMWPVSEVLAKRLPCIIAGFKGLKGFSAAQIVAVHNRWPGLCGVTIELPDGLSGPEVFLEPLARFLEYPAHLKQLAEALRPHLGGAQALGLPAVLGMTKSAEVHARLQELLDVCVFEIPTMPPSITGLRLRDAFEQALFGNVVSLRGKTVEQAFPADGGFCLEVGSPEGKIRVLAKTVVLTTGRFLGGGLIARRDGIRESLFQLPVSQPETRAGWHDTAFLAPAGHGANRAGLLTDAAFRPLDQNGVPVHPHLFAAGAILAHQDWVRSKSGAGQAIATALGAVTSAARYLSGLSPVSGP